MDGQYYKYDFENPRTYRGKPHKSQDEMRDIADKVVELLRFENVTILQAGYILDYAKQALGFEMLK